MLAAHGGISAGYALYVHDGHLVYHYNFLGLYQQVRSDVPVPAGATSLGVRFEVDVDKDGGRDGAALVVDGEVVGAGVIERTLPFFVSWEGLDIGRDALTAVSTDYRDEFPYRDTIDRVVFELADAEGVPFERHD